MRFTAAQLAAARTLPKVFTLNVLARSRIRRRRSGIGLRTRTMAPNTRPQWVE